MSESGDYRPAPWARKHDFNDARRSYDNHVGRSYSDAKRSGRGKKSMLEKSLRTESTSPLVIACDVTGSMGDWPATMFSKLPYLDHEIGEYLGDDAEVSFAAVGDAYCDDYPLQVRPFRRGSDLKKSLTELVVEGGGGGTREESYDLAAMYYANKCDMPNAINPIMIFIGDEGLYDFVEKDQAKEIAGVEYKGRKSSAQAIKDLQNKFSVYLIRKPYDLRSGNRMSSADISIQGQWERMLGADHIAILPEAGRVVDTIFGILAKETDRVEYFRDEIEGRQRPDQIATVYKSLDTIHAELPDDQDVKLLRSGKSVMFAGVKGKKTKSLI